MYIQCTYMYMYTMYMYCMISCMHCTYYFSLMLFLSVCASVAAHYEQNQVFDKLIISLCKFTTLLNPPEVCV